MIALIWMCKQVLLSQYCWIKTCLTTFPTSWTNTFNQVRWLCLDLSYSTNMPPEKGTFARTSNRHTSSRHIFKFLLFMSGKVPGGWRGKCFADNSFPSCDLKDCKGYATSWTFPNVFSWFFLWSKNLFDRSIFAKSSKATQIWLVRVLRHNVARCLLGRRECVFHIFYKSSYRVLPWLRQCSAAHVVICCVIEAKCPSIFLQITTIRYKCTCLTNQNHMSP